MSNNPNKGIAMSNNPKKGIAMSKEYHDQELESTKEDLYLPKFCVVPLAARLEKKLTDSAKIYLGELNVLTNQHGYCWASDEQLAKMKGVSLRTIQSWNTELEKYGFIKRDTWKEHVKNPDPNKNGIIVRTKRKIYVIDDPSNKVSDPQKSAVHCDPQKSAVHCDPQKSAGIKKEPLMKEKENNNPTPSAVVVPFCLEKLEIMDTLRKKISQDYTSEEIEIATKRALNWKNRPSDEAGIMTALRRADTWTDNLSKDEVMRRNKTYLDSIIHLDNKMIGLTKIVIGNKYIEFLTGNKCNVISTDEVDFKLQIKNYLKKIEDFENER